MILLDTNVVSEATKPEPDAAVMAKNSGRGFPTPDGYIAAEG